MDELNEKIKALSRYRIEYFLKNAQATKDLFLKDIKEQITNIVQEIPIAPRQQAQIAYLKGKILNVNPEFDQNAVESLNKALRLDVNNHNAWIELGKANWKKPDIGQALNCFKTAVEKLEDPRSLCYYAAALRNQVNHVSSSTKKRDQLTFIKQSIDLSKKAAEINPNYPFAWYSLGNTYLCRFFVTAQLDAKDLGRSIDSFERALQQSPPFINPDLHVNYAEALTYKQKYLDALQHITKAIEIEPHFGTASERLYLLRSFLFRLNDCIQRKGKLPAKKIKEMIGSINPSAYTNIYAASNYCTLDDLNVNVNLQKFVCLKIIAVVSHTGQIPFTMIGIDEKEAFVGITVFNFSNHFKALVGDEYSIPEPYVIDLENLKISEEVTLNVRLIRVDDPQSLCRNGSKLGPEFKALTSVRFGLN